MKAFIGLLFGFSLALLICAFLGENPLHVSKILFSSAFGSQYDFGLTLFYWTSLMFTGASVAVAFHAGLFNIGAEGQLTVAALGLTSAALLLPDLVFPFSILFVIAASAISGAAWGAIAGALKAYRGAHEVIVTMMLNFIGAGITSYFVLQYFRNPLSQNAESAVFSSQFSAASLDPLQKFFAGSPANFSFLLAVIALVVLHFVLFYSKFGFCLRAVGENSRAAEIYGINPQRYILISFVIAGALAGLVPVNDILGSAQQLKIGFSPDYGFVGIAVALLANNKPAGIVFSALLFAVLQKGSVDLDFESEIITRDYTRILQACLIFGVISSAFFWRKRK